MTRVEVVCYICICFEARQEFTVNLSLENVTEALTRVFEETLDARLKS